jgi:hypothetical protein
MQKTFDDKYARIRGSVQYNRHRDINMKVLSTIIALLFSSSACTDWDFFSSNKIKADEQVIFLPSAASRNPDDGSWLVNFHGWIFEPETFGEINGILRKALDIPADDDPEDEDLFQKRAHWFKVDNERGKRISIQLGDRKLTMNRSVANGHFTGEARLSDQFLRSLPESAQGKKLIHYQAVMDKSDSRAFAGEILLIPDTGLSIISDIDDTIKISNVTDKKELIMNTFMRPFKEAPGMADLYRQWQQQHAAVFHYVSASPWQLYPVLTDFMDKSGFPHGLFHMKSFRWKDSSFLNLFADPVKYKMEIIESILKRYPQRRFILVGDSGEKDPEVYGIIARKYPGQIARILIRKVGDNNTDDRYSSAFADLNAGLWQTFTMTSEIDTTQ